MNEYHPAYPEPAGQRRDQAGKTLGTIGRVLGITVGVILIVGALVSVGVIVLLVHGLNSWGSNK